MPDGEAEQGSRAAKSTGVPALRFASYRGGVELLNLSRSILVIPLVHQTASFSVTGRFVASSPDFLQKSAAQRRKADLTRQIAHKQ